MDELIQEVKLYLEAQTGLNWLVEINTEDDGWQIVISQDNYTDRSPVYDSDWVDTPLNNQEARFSLIHGFLLDFQQVRNRGIVPMYGISKIIRGFLVEEYTDHIIILDFVSLWQLDDSFSFPQYEVVNISKLNIKEMAEAWKVLYATKAEFEQKGLAIKIL
jgi:hypothetical protein